MSDSSVIASRTFNLPFDNIDTDQIIPGEFLTTTEREGLGRYCFHDWRFENGEEKPNHPLKGFNPDRHQVLVTGRNFGCGSSREHAPWALLDFGVRAVISSRFADIFRANSLKNGLLPVTVENEVAEFLLGHADHAVRIEIADHRLSIEDYGEFEFPLNAFSAYCLTRGIDQLEFILEHEKDIRAYEQREGK